ncbi:MAG: SDR family oxidoreductase [Marinoscillum sp.]|uniref:SDR family oxidoreductase n=1 Tax=Marinoscillum sp. TaxID=2024838 RepID=UPI0032FF2AFF
MSDLKDKIVVVTGGTKGIGRAIIEKFSEAGYTIATCARNEADLDDLKKTVEGKYGNKVLIHTADVSKKAQVNDFIEFIRLAGKPVVILVNNAGKFVPGQVHTEEEGVLESQIETNLYSAYRLSRGLIPEMKKRKKGHIFNICSTASITAYTNGGSYCISKFAMYGMSKVLREELKADQIRVTSVMPGATFTASWEGVDLPEDRFMKPEDVAELIFTTYQLSDRTVVEDLVIRPQLGDL